MQRISGFPKVKNEIELLLTHLEKQDMILNKRIKALEKKARKIEAKYNQLRNAVE